MNPWMEHMRRGEWGAAWKISDDVLLSRRGLTDWHLPRHLQSIWNGAGLAGKRVLVRCYHGLGDTIQFVRFVPLVGAIASDVTVWAQPSLIPLLRTMRGIGRLLPLHDGVPDAPYDVDVEVMELAHVFRTTPQTLPAEVPYLHVEPASLDEDGNLRVGLVWQAGDWDERRCVPFSLLAPLAALPGITLHVLQRGVGLLDRPDGWGLVTGSDDVLQAARVMQALDLVISVDSMPVHLAGALGVPVWNLLHADADWRWMEGRDDSPWYPTMRLFRQERPGDWALIIQRMMAELRNLQSEQTLPLRAWTGPSTHTSGDRTVNRSPDTTGSEDNSQALENVRHAAENRDALAEQARRTDQTAPASVDTPVQGFRAGGAGSEDNTESAANARDAAANRDALEAQARRVEATTPGQINTTGPQNR